MMSQTYNFENVHIIKDGMAMFTKQADEHELNTIVTQFVKF